MKTLLLVITSFVIAALALPAGAAPSCKVTYNKANCPKTQCVAQGTRAGICYVYCKPSHTEPALIIDDSNAQITTESDQDSGYQRTIGSSVACRDQYNVYYLTCLNKDGINDFGASSTIFQGANRIFCVSRSTTPP